MSKYSIILPVRNGGDYVKECVSSILAQTYTDFDFIVLDNNSSDGTREWLQSLDDPRIIVYPSVSDLSIEENWGRVKEVQKNEFMTLLGHDDILYPDFLMSMDELINQQPAASLYHTHFNFIDAAGKNIRSCKPMRSTYSGSDFLASFLTTAVDSMGTGYMMRSKDYDAVGGIPVRYPSLLFADFELWVKMAARSFIAIDGKKCFAFRVHKGTTGSSQDSKLHLGLQLFIDFMKGIKKNDAMMAKVINLHGSGFLRFYCESFAHRLLRTPMNKRNGLTVENFITDTKKMAEQLGIEGGYYPERVPSLKAAIFIDKTPLLRNVFLLFKKLYSKPVL